MSDFGRPRGAQWRVSRMKRHVARTTPRQITFSADDIATGAYTESLNRWYNAMRWQLSRSSTGIITHTLNVEQVTDPQTGDVTVICHGRGAWERL